MYAILLLHLFLKCIPLFLQEYGCDAKTVVLRDVHADMSGYYTCEVTTQELYETVTKRHYLQVVRKCAFISLDLYY